MNTGKTGLYSLKIASCFSSYAKNFFGEYRQNRFIHFEMAPLERVVFQTENISIEAKSQLLLGWEIRERKFNSKKR